MIDVQVEIANSHGTGEVDLPTGAEGWVDVARAAVEATLADRGVTDAEVSLTLLDDDDVRTLNREHLDHDRPTDVLSFALYAEGERVLGDVYVGWRQASRQAGREGVPTAEEIARLAVHGTLHVLGHDHPDAAEARLDSEMYRLQEAIVSGLDVDAIMAAPRAPAATPLPPASRTGRGDRA